MKLIIYFALSVIVLNALLTKAHPLILQPNGINQQSPVLMSPQQFQNLIQDTMEREVASLDTNSINDLNFQSILNTTEEDYQRKTTLLRKLIIKRGRIDELIQTISSQLQNLERQLELIEKQGINNKHWK